MPSRLAVLDSSRPARQGKQTKVSPLAGSRLNQSICSKQTNRYFVSDSTFFLSGLKVAAAHLSAAERFRNF